MTSEALKHGTNSFIEEHKNVNPHNLSRFQDARTLNVLGFLQGLFCGVYLYELGIKEPENTTYSMYAVHVVSVLSPYFLLRR